MTVPVRLMPDAEELGVAYLTGMFPPPEAQVVTELWVGFEQQVPVIRVTRIGGAQTKPLILDAPRLDFDIYHSTRAGASELARQVAAVLPAAKGIQIAGGLVTSVTEEIGPSWRPDWNPHIHHFGCTFVLTIRPA